MEAFCDSDEDVYWGPVTLKEKKKDLSRPVLVKNIKRRQTVGCDPSFLTETTKRSTDLIKMEETRTLKPRRSSYPKDPPSEPGFIEKLTQVLDVTTDSSSYHTAMDYIKSDATNIVSSDTLDDIKSTSDIFQSAPSSILLENIQCTLYDSLHFRTLPVDEKTIDETHETSYYNTENFPGTDEVISVSDGDCEVDSTFEGQFEVPSPCVKAEVIAKKSMKNFDINATFDTQLSREENISPGIGENIPSDDDCNAHSGFDNQFINEEVLSSRHVKEGVMFDRSVNALATDNLVSVSDSEDDGNSLPEQELLPKGPRSQEVKSSISDADQLLSDDSLEDKPPRNNNPTIYDCDTSDQHNMPRPPEIRIYDYSNIEMNRLSNVLGNLDIIEEVDEFDGTRKFEIFSSSKSVQNRSSTTSENSDVSAFQFNDTLEEMERLLNQGLNYTMEDKKTVVNNETPAKRNQILTPVKNINLIKSMKKPTPFKSPVPFNTPSTLPKINRNKFKNIQSPVATYIKNAGTTPLVQKVTLSKEMNRIPVKIVKKANQENISQQFPGVRYKPAKQRMITKEEFKLPASIDSLIPIKATVTKHETRIGKASKASILDGDLTVSCDSTMNTTDDISILVSTNALIS